MSYFFTSESVSQGHPDKVCDAISDAIVDNTLAYDPDAHCAIESMVTTGQVIVGGEMRTKTYVDIQTIIRDTIKKIGYTKPEYQFDSASCGILNAIHEQSPDIFMGVNRDKAKDIGDSIGAGDQGMVFGYATNETENYMPLTLDLAHMIVKELALIRENESTVMPYLRPDAKSQVTIEYDENNKPICINTIVVSTQHDEFADTDEAMHNKIYKDIVEIVIPRVKAKCSQKIQELFNSDIHYYVNPTGRFVIGGPASDCGMVNRKLEVDQFGSASPIGGGGLSGKDASKIDRSGAYAARYVAKNCVAAGLADRMTIQVSYAIGITHPVSFFVNTYGTNHTKLSDSQLAVELQKLFDFRPYSIIHNLKLKQPMFSETSSYGHFGRKNEVVHKHFENKYEKPVDIDVELFTWEKLDSVDKIKNFFSL